MAVSDDRTLPAGLHPIHAVLLAGTIPLFLGGLLSDYAYWATYEIEWSNFASWLVAGGNIFSGLALLWAIVHLARAVHRGGAVLLYTLLVLATWLLGFFNSLIHAKDAWAMMPSGLVLSVIVVLLAIIATGVGFGKIGVGGGR